MKIGIIPVVGLESYKNTNIRTPKAGSSSLKPDTLEISDAPKFFSDALKSAMETPTDRLSKVSSIKQRIDDGSYSVTVATVVEKMMSNVVIPKD